MASKGIRLVVFSLGLFEKKNSDCALLPLEA